MSDDKIKQFPDRLGERGLITTDQMLECCGINPKGFETSVWFNKWGLLLTSEGKVFIQSLEVQDEIEVSYDDVEGAISGLYEALMEEDGDYKTVLPNEEGEWDD